MLRAAAGCSNAAGCRPASRSATHLSLIQARPLGHFLQLEAQFNHVGAPGLCCLQRRLHLVGGASAAAQPWCHLPLRRLPLCRRAPPRHLQLQCLRLLAEHPLYGWQLHGGRQGRGWSAVRWSRSRACRSAAAAGAAGHCCARQQWLLLPLALRCAGAFCCSGRLRLRQQHHHQAASWGQQLRWAWQGLQWAPPALPGRLSTSKGDGSTAPAAMPGLHRR